MNKKTNIAILDLGSYKIKGVLSTFSPDGKIQQLIAAREFSQGIESGFIKNKRMTANCISNIFSKLERKTDKNIDFTYIVLNDSYSLHLYFKFFSYLTSAFCKSIPSVLETLSFISMPPILKVSPFSKIPF